MNATLYKLAELVSKRKRMETGMNTHLEKRGNRKMNLNFRKGSWLVAALAVFFLAIAVPQNVRAAAEDEQQVSAEAAEANAMGTKALAAGIAIGLTAAAGAIGMAISIAKASEGISRQPEAAGDIRSSLTLGLVFIETAIIYALIVAILIIFVL